MGIALPWNPGEHRESIALRKNQAARAKQKSSCTRLGKHSYALGLETEKQQRRIGLILPKLTPTGFFSAKIGQKMNKVGCSMPTHRLPARVTTRAELLLVKTICSQVGGFLPAPKPC